MLGYAIDVSHHQSPGSLPWGLYKGAVDLVIVRATYGSEVIDNAAAGHLERARDIGAKVGLYHFYRPNQPWEAQALAFEKAMIKAGLDTGDIVPAIDVELDPFSQNGAVSKKWEQPVEDFVNAMRMSYGDCVVYITRADWILLGREDWVLQRPLWVANYTLAPKPYLPGDNVCMEPVLWQHRVGPFDRKGVGGVFKSDGKNVQVDQNRILGPIPTIGGGTWSPEEPDAEPSDPSRAA